MNRQGQQPSLMQFLFLPDQFTALSGKQGKTTGNIGDQKMSAGIRPAAVQRIVIHLGDPAFMEHALRCKSLQIRH